MFLNKFSSKKIGEILALNSFVLVVLFLINNSFVDRLTIFALSIVLFLFAKKKFKLLRVIIFMASIIIANVIIPEGKLLFRVFNFPVTQDALFSGIKKAITFESLIFISSVGLDATLLFNNNQNNKTKNNKNTKFALLNNSSKAIANFISITLNSYTRINNEKTKIEGNDIIGSIDRILFSVYYNNTDISAKEIGVNDNLNKEFKKKYPLILFQYFMIILLIFFLLF